MYHVSISPRLSLLLVLFLTLALPACDLVEDESDEMEDESFTEATITAVTIEDIPFSTSQGEGWDLTSAPDPYWQLFDSNDNSQAVSDVRFDNVNSNSLPIRFTNINFNITDFNKRFSFVVWDDDATTADDFMGSTRFFQMSEPAGNGYPSTLTVSGGDVRITMDLVWR
jgi:hypothetical protein